MNNLINLFSYISIITLLVAATVGLSITVVFTIFYVLIEWTKHPLPMRKGYPEVPSIRRKGYKNE